MDVPVLVHSSATFVATDEASRGRTLGRLQNPRRARQSMYANFAIVRYREPSLMAAPWLANSNDRTGQYQDSRRRNL